jgi:hypothetical protein
MDAALVVPQPVASAVLTGTDRIGHPQDYTSPLAPWSRVARRARRKSEIRISKCETNPNEPKSNDPNGCGWFGYLGNSLIRACFEFAARQPYQRASAFICGQEFRSHTKPPSHEDRTGRDCPQIAQIQEETICVTRRNLRTQLFLVALCLALSVARVRKLLDWRRGVGR